ncbi:hypothetical protein HMN09_00299900 [Mycena chlorophos]|uniref:Methyltransferase domain-containing protein n=1 Tax=Mycena chlorophos TaxID=658473 RepID=A0A8H6TKT7_MYCCL|nr:hypothetical protein HMN09_00299900 [Mycena chlorophos]
MAHTTWNYIPPLNSGLWKSVEEDNNGFDFLISQTGIKDTTALEKHVLKIQQDAYKVFPYPCIRLFDFVKTRIARHPAYPAVLELQNERPEAIVLDLGCCFGVDVRKFVADGFAKENVLACDLFPEFWKRGHELFRTTPETFPVAFLQGNLLDHTFLPFPADAITPSEIPSLATLSSLGPLIGRASVIHMAYLFHVFNEEQHIDIAQRIAGLLSPRPGSIILGSQIARQLKQGYGTYYLDDSEEARATGGIQCYCHTPDSWKALWEGIFPAGSVRIDAALRPRSVCQPTEVLPGVIEAEDQDGILMWSITRL